MTALEVRWRTTAAGHDARSRKDAEASQGVEGKLLSWSASRTVRVRPPPQSPVR